MQVCQAELFTDIAEEKEVAQIGSKVREAKAIKSFSIYNILASVLLTTSSHKTVKKCDDCLHSIVLGLSANEGIPVEDLLIYAHQVISQNAPNLVEKPQKPTAEPPRLLEEKTDVYLVPQEPARSGLPVRTSKRANAHVLVEYGLKIVTTSLRCLGKMLRMPLPALRKHVHRLGKALFVLLHKYAGAGMKQGDNFQLLVLAFKVMTTLVKEGGSLYQLSRKQLLVLLTYIEHDVYDHSRQSVAFALLKAILHRRIDAEEVHELMDKVATMSIADEQAHIRSQCREAYLQYVLDYPMRRRMKKAVGFFTAQLEYSTVEGRLSALEMLHSYSVKFPPDVLAHYSGVLFVSISARLVNDTTPSVRRVAAAGIRSLLEKFATRRLASQLLGLFAEVEKEAFARHLPALLPTLVEQMHPSRFDEFAVEDIERTKDHIAYLYLVSLSKAAIACKLARAPATQEDFGTLCGYAAEYLLHAHAWVRLAASQFYGAVFTAYTPDELAAACAPDANLASQDYLLTDTPTKIRSLTEKFCSQLQPSEVLPETMEQVSIRSPPLSLVALRGVRAVLDLDSAKPMLWILKKVSREAHAEVVSNPRCIIKRSHVFKFVAAVSLDLTKAELHSHLELILKPVCRELEDQSPSQSEEMKQLANEVSGVVKKAAGVEAFGAALVALQGKLSGKKMKRKHDKALEMVRNPEMGARKKIKQQVRKKEALKRKMAIQHGKKAKRRKKAS
ncbi:hypothetical protein HPB48_000614 [Haemaphysalis longicornis]|uniref:Uncharacterized protein n=1 Tax=Haemaphysalis longicornis TaxID=44386 RepID=A0A9J6GZR3_HAELO|nr:hypothetical protein HPB48_000614 [Haemaphysalis longicornis]